MPKPLTTYEQKLSYSRALTDKFVDELGDLTSQYRNGDISLLTWQISMRAELRKDYALQLITASGGDVGSVDPNDWLKLGSILKEQYAYLENFATDLENGLLDGIEARAGLYAKSSQGVFWRQLYKDANLPTYPGEQTCLGNCGCEWLDNGDGSYTWKRNKNDSCEDCINNEAIYNPYVASEA